MKTQKQEELEEKKRTLNWLKKEVAELEFGKKYPCKYCNETGFVGRNGTNCEFDCEKCNGKGFVRRKYD